MLHPAESLCHAAAVILDRLVTTGIWSQQARDLGLVGYVAWPRPCVGQAPDLVYRQMAEILAGVASTDPLITQTAWGRITPPAGDRTAMITAETAMGEVVVMPASRDLPHGGTVFWFDADALRSLQLLARGDERTLVMALLCGGASGR